MMIIRERLTSVYSGHLWKVTRLIQACKLQLQTLVLQSDFKISLDIGIKINEPLLFPVSI
jgi:hypothetical protein